MSRVVIEIDGVRWGMAISVERMVEVISTLNAVAVESQKDARSPKASVARAEARDAFQAMLTEISFAMQKPEREVSEPEELHQGKPYPHFDTRDEADA